ncbi:K(+)-transporting ATPase subunit F [Luteolibacter sp. LG18]|uniref:K(+)-transporting ATPase subunit F n=1 Tax=Luteolibacter sp. LG18 TaxID=2819286 RepID=UPI0030C77684
MIPTSNQGHDRSPLHRRHRRILRPGGGIRPVLRPPLNPPAMETILTGVIAFALLAYLFVAMIHPERF